MKYNSRLVRLFSLVVILALFNWNCNNGVAQYDYSIPLSLEDGLTTGHWADVDLDTTRIYKLVSKIQSAKIKEVHSLLIYKDGKLVLEEYFTGHDYNWENDNFWGPEVQWDKDRLHHIMSDTKSVTSLLIGIAIDQGFIEHEGEPIFKYLPEYKTFNNQGREQIKIEHLLTMTSGLEGNEWVSSYRNLDNPIISLWLCDDPIECILDRPMVAAPGTQFSYWGGNQILLGEILKNASGMEVNSFAEKYLFEPLQIADYDWTYVNNGPQEAAGGLELTPRSMAKIGITVLNNGLWNKSQIIPQDWVIKSEKPYRNNTEIRVPGLKSWRHGYTYGWWTKSWKDPIANTVFAGGWGGQNIFILPDYDMVVVFTGGNYNRVPPPKKIMDQYIIPALIRE